MKQNTQRFNLKILGLFFLLAGLSFAIGLYFNASKGSLSEKQIHGTLLSHPRDIAQFSLISDKGKPIDNINLTGQWSMMFFGFTNCPHICPTTMAELNKVYQKLQQDNVNALPQIMMVSIDPARDNVKRMHAYVTGFNKNFIGATGKKQKIDNMTKDLGIVYMKTQGQAGNYNIDHSGTIMLINPQGKLVAFFSMPHDANKIVEDYEKIINA